MKTNLKKYLTLFFACLSFLYLFNASADEYPNTSLAVIDLNKLLNVSKVAINANEQIEKISKEIDENLAKGEKEIINEQQKLIEAQSIMAPEAFEKKRIEYEKKVQDFQINSQNTLIKLENNIAIVRSQILDEVQPILEEISKEKGITVILEKGTVILNAENMDITELVLKKLNKKLPKIKVEFDE
mgnify:CR=1 FL=1